MKKKYVYKNGVIYISIPDNSSETIQNATEIFMKRIVLEHGQSYFRTASNNRKTGE